MPENIDRGFIRHALDKVHCIHTGRLPEALLPGRQQFDVLWDMHPPEYPTVVIHGRKVSTPRWSQAFGADYHFAGTDNPALPVPPGLEPFLAWARAAIDGRLAGILVNWYDGRLGHYIGAHRDSTAHMVPGAPIVTVSLGEERAFRMRPWKGKGYRDFAAANGVVIVLPYETNLAYTHEVPHAARHTGRRISVTIRAFEAGVVDGPRPARPAAPVPADPVPAEVAPPTSLHNGDGIPALRKFPTRVIPYSAQRVTAYAVFDRIVRGFLSGTMSQLIVGPRGVQKSRTIEGLLGGSVQYVVGRTTTWGLYHALYLHRDRLIVLDDLDRLYALPDAVALLKCVAAKAVRKTVGWNSDRTLKDADVPRSFATTSRVILVANRWVTSNDDVLALEDRCITVFFQPGPAEVHARARTWVVPQDAEVYDFVGAHLGRCRELSMRLYDTAMEYRRYGLDWRRVVLELLDAGPPEEEPEAPEQVVQSLQATDLPSHRDRVRAFRKRTGQSQATYYRIRKRLLDGQSPRGK